MTELITDVLADPVFAVCALVGIAGALMVVVRRNPVYCAVGLMVSFLSFAVIFVKLNAAFLAAMHVLVYTGAILVLFLFVILLLNLSEKERGAEYHPATKGAVALLAAGLCALILFAVMKDPSVDGQIKPLADQTIRAGDQTTTIVANDWGGVSHAGRSLFTFWVFPFELVSILVVVAILGAVMLAKKNLPPEL